MTEIASITPWVKVELYGSNNDGGLRRFTVADGTQISKGILLALSDPRTAAAAGALETTFAGVAAMEKVANDGSTSISAWTDGIFEAVASLAIGVGQPILGAERSSVGPASTLVASGAGVLGYALEEAAAGETINVRLRL